MIWRLELGNANYSSIIPRAPSGFQIPHKSLKKQRFYAGATGFSGSGSGNAEADSNLNNPHSKSQDQC